MVANLFSVIGGTILIITDATGSLSFLNTASLFVSKFGAAIAY
jgi:hypothetical protein